MTTPPTGHTGPGTLQAADPPPGQNMRTQTSTASAEPGPSMSTGEVKAENGALAQARARHPHWGIWISSAGRYWATRQGSARLTTPVHVGWAMTVDADSLAELETRIQAQKHYEQAPALSPGERKDCQP